MRVRLTMLAALVVTCAALGTMSATATAGPLLCEKSGCGGKGAQEYSEQYAKEGREFGVNFGFINVKTFGCMKNSQYGAQWDCWGQAEESLEGEFYEWHMWVGEYGGFKHALWE